MNSVCSTDRGLDAAVADGGVSLLPRDGFLPRQFAWYGYESLLELRDILTMLDARDDVSQSHLLVLDDTFAGNLVALIRRRRQGGRLMIASRNNRLPLPIPPEQLVALAGELNWRSLQLEPSLGHAAIEATNQLPPNQRLTVLWPDWRNPAAMQALLRLRA